ncbi:MAG: hypothetical protein WCH79_00305, partial [Planctomycetia bacterium]
VRERPPSMILPRIPPPAAFPWRSSLLPLVVGVTLTVAGGGILSAQPRGLRPGLAGGTAGAAGEGAGQPLWISATPLDDGRQLLLIIDPQMKNAAIYHVDGTGSLTLRSTRNIAWDLLVPEYNAQEPRPATLKKMLEVGAEGVPAGQNRP